MDVCFTGKGNADDIKRHELQKTVYPSVADRNPYSNNLTAWERFQNDLGVWADATFGAGRPPERSFSHLQEEVEELIASPYDLKEYADCFILLIDSARRAGYDMETILKACNDKLEINKKRKWGTPDASGKVNHVPGT